MPVARVIFEQTHFTMGGMFPSFIVRGTTIAQGLVDLGVARHLLGALAGVQANRLREAEALRHLS